VGTPRWASVRVPRREANKRAFIGNRPGEMIHLRLTTPVAGPLRLGHSSSSGWELFRPIEEPDHAWARLRKTLFAEKLLPSLVRSSAAEYLTFVAASGTGGVEAVYADENVWLSQKMMAQLYDVDVPTINYHLKKVFEDSELEEDAVIRNFRITAADGKTYDTKHYNLSAIIAVGYKVNSERAVQFRKWATRVVEEFTIKGFAMDDERLKRGGSVLSERTSRSSSSASARSGCRSASSTRRSPTSTPRRSTTT
jgi:hypothetical protein